MWGCPICFQHQYGGPIIAMQIENEYGSYNDDKAYMSQLRSVSVQHNTWRKTTTKMSVHSMTHHFLALILASIIIIMM